MNAKAFPLLLALSGAAWSDEYQDSDDYGSGSYYEYGGSYGRSREEEPTGYISNGPMVMPTYRGESGIAIGSGEGRDFVGTTTTSRGSCFSAYGITSCY
jgi:hypothetical protein